MLLGDLLVAQGLCSAQDIQLALERQATHGGLLGQNLIALGKITAEQLQQFLEQTPVAPATLAETGLTESFLLALAVKMLYVRGLELPSELAGALGLPTKLASDLLGIARDRRLAEVIGSASGSMASEMRYALTAKGKEWAVEALEQSQYVGPAPVTLPAYVQQVQRQTIRAERISHDHLRRHLGHLVLPDSLLRELGPAVNSGRAMLVYGPPGNGKTSVAEAIGRAFQGVVHVPHALEVDGQVIKIFDPVVHEHVARVADTSKASLAARALERPVDRRWVACRRPVIIAGGELTMEMLDLGFNPFGKVYEAPLQMKAANGVFIIDDFGRQSCSPKEILNRWIYPLQKSMDFLALNTGRKFHVPFDCLLAFSTNLDPSALIDDAFLRRIPYKILMPRPTPEDYAEIFRRVCAAYRLELPSGVIEFLFTSYYRKYNLPLSSNHPKFIVDGILDYCRYVGKPPQITPALIVFALRNLSVTEATRPPPPPPGV